MMNAVAGATYVVHIASPIALQNATLEEYVGPAVAGTKAIVNACAANGVRRCVITSSIASIQSVPEAQRPAVFNESHWSDPERPEGMSNYAKSKTLAEKAAWDYQASLPED